MKTLYEHLRYGAEHEGAAIQHQRHGLIELTAVQCRKATLGAKVQYRYLNTFLMERLRAIRNQAASVFGDGIEGHRKLEAYEQMQRESQWQPDERRGTLTPCVR